MKALFVKSSTWNLKHAYWIRAPECYRRRNKLCNYSVISVNLVTVSYFEFLVWHNSKIIWKLGQYYFEIFLGITRMDWHGQVKIIIIPGWTAQWQNQGGETDAGASIHFSDSGGGGGKSEENCNFSARSWKLCKFLTLFSSTFGFVVPYSACKPILALHYNKKIFKLSKVLGGGGKTKCLPPQYLAWDGLGMYKGGVWGT